MPAGVSSSISVLKRFNGTNPAANTECSDTVPAGKSWIVLAYSVQLVSGGGDTPQPILTVDDGTTVMFESFGSTTAQAVSTTCRYTWASQLPLTGLIGATTNVHSTAPLPRDLVLYGGSRIRTTTIGASATTDYGAPSLYVIEYG